MLMKPHNIHVTDRAVLGCLLGTAIGDAIGLPAEGLPRAKAERFCAGGLRHRLLFGKGMFSDDTEHTLMVAVALRDHRTDPDAFQKALATSLKWWLLALPAAVGFSTAKAIVRLWLGFPVSRAGVRSAGNGAAMRSAILGACLSHDSTVRKTFTLKACRLTHTDPRAEESALLVSEAAALATRHADTSEVMKALRPFVESNEMQERWEKLEVGLLAGWEVHEFAGQIGCERGVSGFAPNSVAVALFAWLRHRGDFRQILTAAISCGGDTDTVAAIAGGIAGAEVGEQGIPVEWVDGLRDWPISITYIRGVAAALTNSRAPLPPRRNWAIPVRNLLFLLIVLTHGFRRLVPN